MNSPLRCVIDASVAIKQFVPDPLSSQVFQLFAHLGTAETEFFIPDLFYIEIANILWKYVRAGLYAAGDVPIDLANLKQIPLHVVSMAELMEDAFNIAITYGISAYYGSYVALSKRVNAPLLTLDKKLVNTLANTSYNVRLFNDFLIPPSS
ncbi:type II toxin-antitoxin system VapC family toxin [Planktothrix sp. FACHB-1365]|uniref:type II toxin-antitoxin system VapC family toxin n=1 Tax=Planktothrix sp. FACHB-1365 TaxID=2692855 RepID=UPI0016872BAF|nr:type II toxin-antitoxin system VapC family toxin [Planktothrix sp. FACHB-1365]MBD2483625.1 type II toxin-antitoxin system VapC family toxin [Planktothrix sp. FACHB-1365]